MYNVIMRRVHATIVTMENQCSECVFLDLAIQHAKNLYRVLSSVASPTLHNVSTLSHIRKDFRKEILEDIRVFSFSLQICVKHFSF